MWPATYFKGQVNIRRNEAFETWEMEEIHGSCQHLCRSLVTAGCGNWSWQSCTPGIVHLGQLHHPPSVFHRILYSLLMVRDYVAFFPGIVFMNNTIRCLISQRSNYRHANFKKVIFLLQQNNIIHKLSATIISSVLISWNIWFCGLNWFGFYFCQPLQKTGTVFKPCLLCTCSHWTLNLFLSWDLFVC